MGKEFPSDWQRLVPKGITIERLDTQDFDIGYQANFIIHAGLEDLLIAYSFIDTGDNYLTLQYQTLLHTPQLSSFDKYARYQLPRRLITTQKTRQQARKNILINLTTKDGKEVSDQSSLKEMFDETEVAGFVNVSYQIPLSTKQRPEFLVVGFMNFNDDIGNLLIQTPARYNGLMTARFISTTLQEPITGVNIDTETAVKIAGSISVLSDYLNV